MDKKTIDNIVWWIPFRKLRYVMRYILCEILITNKEVSKELNRKLDGIISQNILIEARQKLYLLTDKKIVKETRNPRLIVSLTTYPERHHDVDIVIYSLLIQSIIPDKIVLWLSHEEYPNGLDSVPENILRLQKFGLEIDFCKNITCYKNCIPSLIKYPNDMIVTADDDIYYPHNWLELLYNAYLENPNYINCHRAHKITFENDGNISAYSNWEHEKSHPVASYLNFPSGTGAGIIVNKNLFHNDITNSDIFLKLSPTNDDIWIWAMAVLNNTKIRIVNNNISKPQSITILKNYKRLCYINIFDGYNDKQIKNILEHYPQIKEILEFDSIAYWEERYMGGGNSGEGSYGKLAEFKSDIINNFIASNNIESVIEWGCGDGEQLAAFKIPKYYGFEISPYIVKTLMEKFEKDKTKTFSLVSDYSGFKADCAMSLDVIFTIVEDDKYENYMKMLFDSANKYVIIHSSNKDERTATHIKHRKFTDWVDANLKEWKLNKFIENNIMTKEGVPSFNDFYIYRKE